MFETAELGASVSKKEFEQRENSMRMGLLECQFQLREAGIPVIILLSGVEGSNRSDVVRRLNKWMDPRYLHTHAFWDETDEEKQRPEYWRFWRCLPQRGESAIMFGSWYTRPIVDEVFNNLDLNAFELALNRINEFEKMLCDDGYVVIKFWYHISQQTQQKRLAKKTRAGKSPTAALFKKYASQYEHFVTVSERALQATDTLHSPWHIVEATDKRYRDLKTGEILTARLEAALANHRRETEAAQASVVNATENILDSLDLSQTIDEKNYESELASYQKKLSKLVWKTHEQNRSIVILFEGADAAGKGGAIRRITAAMDARLYQVIPVAAPSDEELKHHYLWRFWRHIPRGGYISIYDRSWYGRVLVERVEKFAQPEEWQRAYHEIHEFEQQLVDKGTIVCKYWLQISKDEQLKRFKEREAVPWKIHKITEEDWRNREKWDSYKQAAHDMITHTSSDPAPWNLIPAENKYFARLEILKTLCQHIEKSIES